VELDTHTDVTTEFESVATDAGLNGIAAAGAGRPAQTVATAPDFTDVEVTHRSVPEVFQAQVTRRGDHPAMYFKASNRWHSVNWQQYGQGVKRIAGFLLSEGVRHGERVAILSGNRPEWHIADLAIEHVGAVVVGVYPTNSSSQCQYIIDHAEAPVVFAENRDQLAKILATRGDMPHLRRVVLVSGELQPGDGELVVTWAGGLAAGDTYNREHPGEFEDRWGAVGLDDLATFIYTSGTTGPPKAVMIDHRNIIWTASSILKTISLSTETPDDDVTISYLPLAHVAERVAGHILHVYVGHRIYFAEDIAHLAANVTEVRPTFMFGVPRIWEKYQAVVQAQIAGTGGVQGLLARWAIKQGAANVDRATSGEPPDAAYKLADRLVLSKIRVRLGLDRAKQLSSGAAPINPETLRFFWGLGLPIFEVYGQSEDTGPTSTGRIGYCRLGTVGPAMPGVEIKIAEDGEVLVKGTNVFRGYFKDDAATREALDAQGYLHSGDVGVLEDGFLRITDRKKDLIITAGGKNISPSNIEVALKRLPFIGQAVAIGDSRPFMSALLTVDAEQVAALAKQVGEPADILNLSQSEKVRELFQAGVDAVNANLANVEKIKKFSILPNDLSLDGGELTPTMKVKRKVVNEKYADLIQAIYSS
jgi:long-subunit acyl-CoA synthetase (AMP-forming)